MLWLVFLTCILADALNAGSSLAEREASQEPGMGRLFSKQLSLLILKNRIFLLGLALQLLATVLEIIALSQGSLVLIGPLLTLDIVFLWTLISWRYGLKVTFKSWVAVASVVVGLGLVFISAQPKSGQANYNLLGWSVAAGITTLLIALAFLLSRSQVSAKLLVIMLSLATACNYALDAGLVKLVLEQWKDSGLAVIFLSWPLYTLIIFAVTSIVLTQNTYRVGPVSLAQPIIEIAQAVASVLIGIFIFHDIINRSWYSLAGFSLSLLLIGIGISLLASSKGLFNTGRP